MNTSSSSPSNRLLLALTFCAALVLPRAASGAGAACQTMIPCQSDSDCGAGTRCVAGAATVCTTGADGGQSCALSKLCGIPWQYTCQADSDCGDGFTCNLSGQSCDCSGSNANVPASAVSTPCSQVPEPPGPSAPSICDGGSCLCWHIGTCAQQATSACTSAGQCPSGWSCTSGTCEPPCYGEGTTFGGTSSGGTSGDAGKNGASSGSGGGCGIATSDSSNAGAWLALVTGAVALAGKRRRARG